MEEISVDKAKALVTNQYGELIELDFSRPKSYNLSDSLLINKKSEGKESSQD